MSEACCNGCKAAAGKFAAKLSCAELCKVCSVGGVGADAAAECAPSKNRVQVRAKVLYGSGSAIANLRAKEKLASNRPNL